MEAVKNLAEFYDELYPVTECRQKFFEERLAKYPHPAKILGIGCGTGILCHRLAKMGFDATGLEAQHALLESASRRYINQLMSLRYFQMSTLEMSRFLGKSFYNIISCLNSRVIFIHDSILMRKFFFDCRELLTTDGILVINLVNFQKYTPDSVNKKIVLPLRESVRVLYKSSVSEVSGDNFVLDSFLQKGGRNYPVYERAEIYPLKKNEIEGFAREAGFSKIEFYSDFNLSPLSPDSDYITAVIS